MSALGLGTCRLVELARALVVEPELLMADEPSSGLDVHETAELAAVLRIVQRDRGTAVLLVEHDLAMVADVVDRTVVMDLGPRSPREPSTRSWRTRPSASPTWAARREPGAGPGSPSGPAPARRRSTTAPPLEVSRVCAAYGPYRALFDVSFNVPAGGVVALIGSNGAGKSTVARTVRACVRAPTASVRFGRHTTSPGLAAWRIARLGMAHVVEGRGIFSSLTVEENLVLVFRQRAGRVRVGENLARAYEAFPILGQRRKQAAGTLSGGQQRLLSLAKVLVVPPKLLVADELSLGLAPVVVDAVYEGLEAINRNGTAMLVVEQQIDRVLKLASKARRAGPGARCLRRKPGGSGLGRRAAPVAARAGGRTGGRPRRGEQARLNERGSGE